MDNNEVLGHLLVIESEASVLVRDAQAEADRRVAQAEKENRSAYDRRFRVESERLEDELQKAKEQARRQYHEELKAYIRKLSSVQADADLFSALLDKFIAEGA